MAALEAMSATPADQDEASVMLQAAFILIQAASRQILPNTGITALVSGILALVHDHY